MNYIKHLNTVMEKFAEDDRLNPSHISLYLALFQMWNFNRFNNPISITRNDVMKISKIGSKTTYLKALHDLSSFGYLEYLPSKNPLRGSMVNMFKFWPSTVHVTGHDRTKNWPSTGQVLAPSINSNKHINYNEQTGFHPPDLEEVKNFFKEKVRAKDHDTEAQKFFNYYRSNGWKIGKNPMLDWQAAADNWILKINEQKNQQLTQNHLHTNQDKNYGEPL